MNIVTMSRAGAVARLSLVSLIAFGTTLLTLGDARPGHVLAWEDWVKAALAALYVAYNYMSKAWAASSTDAPPLNALVGVSAPLAPSPQAVYYATAPLPAAPNPVAPVSANGTLGSVAPGAAQGTQSTPSAVSGQAFSDVAAGDDPNDDELVAGRESAHG